MGTVDFLPHVIDNKYAPADFLPHVRVGDFVLRQVKGLQWSALDEQFPQELVVDSDVYVPDIDRRFLIALENVQGASQAGVLARHDFSDEVVLGTSTDRMSSFGAAIKSGEKNEKIGSGFTCKISLVMYQFGNKIWDSSFFWSEGKTRSKHGYIHDFAFLRVTFLLREFYFPISRKHAAQPLYLSAHTAFGCVTRKQDAAKRPPQRDKNVAHQHQ